MKSHLTRALTVIGIVACATPALADDIRLGAMGERSWYGTISAGPELYSVNYADGTLDDALANTFWGVGGSAELCHAGTGTMDWLDLCAGAHAFRSLGSGQEVVQGGAATTEVNLTTYGAYAKARAHLGWLTVAPYAGARQLAGDISLTAGALGTAVEDIDEMAFFGGIETGLSLFNDRVELGLGGEVGRTNSDTELTYYAGRGFVRIRF